MQRKVLFLTEPHSLLCKYCTHSEQIKTLEDNEYAYICHTEDAINTGDECSKYKTTEKIMREIQNELNTKKDAL